MKYLLLLIFTINLYSYPVDISYDFCNGGNMTLKSEEKWEYNLGTDKEKEVNGIHFTRNLDEHDKYYHNTNISTPFYFNTLYPQYSVFKKRFYKVNRIEKHPYSSNNINIYHQEISCEVDTTCNADQLNYGNTCVPNIENYIPILPVKQKCLFNQINNYDGSCINNPLYTDPINYYVKNKGSLNTSSYCGLGKVSTVSKHQISIKIPSPFLGVTFNKTKYTNSITGELMTIPFLVKDKRYANTTFVTNTYPTSSDEVLKLEITEFTCLECVSGYNDDGSCKDIPDSKPIEQWLRTDSPECLEDWLEQTETEFTYIGITCEAHNQCVEFNEERRNGDGGQTVGDETLINNFKFSNIRIGALGGYIADMTKTTRTCVFDGLPDKNDTDKNTSLCADGGAPLNNTCDRSCEDVNMVSVRDYNVELWTSSQRDRIKCVPKVDCDIEQSKCISKCGSLSNIDIFNCDEGLNKYECRCIGEEEPNLEKPKDDIYDDEVTEEPNQEEETVDTLSEDGKQLKNDNLKNRKLLKEIQKDIRKGNEGLNDQLKIANESLKSIDDSTFNNTVELKSIDNELDKQTKELEGINEKLKTQNDRDTMSDNLGETVNDINNNNELEAKNANENGVSDSKGNAQSVIDNLNSALSVVNNGFNFSAPPATNINNTVRVFNKDIVIDPCPSFSQFSSIINLMITIILLALSIKFYLIGFSYMRKD